MWGSQHHPQAVKAREVSTRGWGPRQQVTAIWQPGDSEYDPFPDLLTTLRGHAFGLAGGRPKPPYSGRDNPQVAASPSRSSCGKISIHSC
jgi:hypothetical protein